MRHSASWVRLRPESCLLACLSARDLNGSRTRELTELHARNHSQSISRTHPHPLANRFHSFVAPPHTKRPTPKLLAPALVCTYLIPAHSRCFPHLIIHSITIIKFTIARRRSFAPLQFPPILQVVGIPSEAIHISLYQQTSATLHIACFW